MSSGEYGSKVEALEKELLSAQEYIAQQREAYTDTQELSLELERERSSGRWQSFLVIVDVVIMTIVIVKFVNILVS